ncbi:pullulanase X25 domain-containing protein, partial [Oscillospiraceae bacterium LCP25S3_E10]
KEQYRKDAVEAGHMDFVSGSSSLYRKTFTGIKKGTYAFKVGTNGSLDMSWGANGSNENYTFTLTKTADVTVTFNRDKQTVSVTTTPTDALDIKQYVVTGTENLMGKTWDLNEAVMTYNEEAGVYEYTQHNVTSGQNYAFKIIEKGIDSGSNISFSLSNESEKYDIKFTYNPQTGAVTKQAFNVETGEDVSDSVIKGVVISSYSVLGDKGLTGYSWLGLTDKGTPGTKE